MDSLYKSIILENYRHPQNFGRLKDPDKTVQANNEHCGDRITLDVKLKNGRLKDIRFWSQGCAISMASASILTQAVKGKTAAEIFRLDKSFVLKKLGIKLSPNRLKCALLPLEAIQKALR